jgi:hypothetical protein
MLLLRITVLEFSALLQHSIALSCVLPGSIDESKPLVYPVLPPLYVSTGIRIANIYYMLVYVKNVVASNAIYLDVI